VRPPGEAGRAREPPTGIRPEPGADLHGDRPAGADHGRGDRHTIAEAGFAGASFARIAGKLGISRGLISYHFAGKDDLVKEVIHQAAEQAKAFIRPRILAEPTGPGMLRAYIESNLAFMRDHRNNVIAMVEIAGSRRRGPV
jgi:AcrR family transcriptional regulator